MPFALIFISGGAILALELLASRIMTPYFGVSLFIWTGILSITLISLAFGYWWGGRLAGGSKAPTPQRLALLFAIMPALASAKARALSGKNISPNWHTTRSQHSSSNH